MSTRPPINFPPSTNIVRVRMIDTKGIILIPAKNYIRPLQAGHEWTNVFVASFLIDHMPSGRKILFDLGSRKDYWNLPPVLQKLLSEFIPALRVDEDVIEILENKGIALEEISSIVWSHYHWDHTGNTAAFPSSTELVVGPGFKASDELYPGFPHNINSPVDARVFENRRLTEIDFTESDLTIGGYRAFDFFGDGSFYLLDTPGHVIGHICGLARTTPGTDSTFILFGGDICHFPGSFRPSPGIPLPDPISEGALDRDPYFPSPCACSLFSENHPQKDEPKTDGKSTPFFLLSTEPTSEYKRPEIAQQSVNELVEFDSDPHVMVCIAHDEAMIKSLPTLNDSPEEDLNAWKEKGYKEKIHWGWLNDLPRNGKNGRKPAVEGFWRDGKLWPNARAELAEMGAKASQSSLGAQQATKTT